MSNSLILLFKFSGPKYWKLFKRVKWSLSRNFVRISNHIGDVMVSVLSSNAGDRGCEPKLGQTKDYRIGICQAHSIKEKDQRLVSSDSG